MMTAQEVNVLNVTEKDTSKGLTWSASGYMAFTPVFKNYANLPLNKYF